MEYTYVLSMGCWQNPVSENQSVKKKKSRHCLNQNGNTIFAR